MLGQMLEAYWKFYEFTGQLRKTPTNWVVQTELFEGVHLILNNRNAAKAMLTILQRFVKHGWLVVFQSNKRNTNVMKKSEEQPKLSLRKIFADDKAISFTIRDLTCWYSCGLSAEFSIIVWTMVIKGSFSFIYFKSGGAYSKHQFTAWLDLKDDTVKYSLYFNFFLIIQQITFYPMFFIYSIIQ